MNNTNCNNEFKVEIFGANLGNFENTVKINDNSDDFQGNFNEVGKIDNNSKIIEIINDDSTKNEDFE